MAQWTIHSSANYATIRNRAELGVAMAPFFDLPGISIHGQIIISGLFSNNPIKLDGDRPCSDPREGGEMGYYYRNLLGPSAPSGIYLGQGISVFSVNDFGILWQERGKWNQLSISPGL